MAVSIETLNSRSSGSNARESASPLEVVVLHTTMRGTLTSLRTAAALAAGLAAHIRLLVLEVVPYPLPVESPRVPLSFTHRRFSTVAKTTRIDTRVDILVGRDETRMLDSALKPRSLVVLDGRGKWWPTRTGRLARRLERLGHHVVFAK